MSAGLQLKLLVLAIWLAMMAFFAKNLIRGRASVNWPKLAAKVESSSVEAKSGGNGLTLYSPVIEYKYSVNGVNYSSKNFTYMGTIGITKKYAENYTNKFTVGSEIQAFYNPKIPEMAVIIPGVHWAQYIGLLFFTLFFLCAAFIVEVLNFIWPGCEPNCT